MSSAEPARWRMNLYRCSRCRELIVSSLATRVGRCESCGGRVTPIWMPRPNRAKPGSFEAGEGTWASLEDFVGDRPERLASREVDYGLLWRPSASGPTFRAAWIEDTGELYIVQSGPPAAGGGHVELLAVTDRDGVERALAGWEPASKRPGSLAWLRRRASALPRPSGRRPPRSGPAGSPA